MRASRIAAIVVVVLMASSCHRLPAAEQPTIPMEQPPGCSCCPPVEWVIHDCSDGSCVQDRNLLTSRRSPCGRYVIYAKGDEESSIGVLDTVEDTRRDLFVLSANVTAERYEEILLLEGIQTWPTRAFWAGDGSGVYLWYQNLFRMWYVSVPQGVTRELTADSLFNAMDQSRIPDVIGSPSGTRQLLVLEYHGYPGLYTYRLVVMDEDGQELECILEFDQLDDDSWAAAEATADAVLLERGPNEDVRLDEAVLSTSIVWLYLRTDAGWDGHNLGRLSSPRLRRSAVTAVTIANGKPCLVEAVPGHGDRFLFDLPQKVIDMTVSQVQYHWCESGDRVLFPQSGVIVSTR